MRSVVLARSAFAAVVAFTVQALPAYAQDSPDAGPDVDAGTAPPPLTPEQQAYVEQLIEQRIQQVREEMQYLVPPPPPPPTLTMRADIYNKLLLQNDQSNGSVTWGTPNPQGDNFSGNNGAASELALTFTGRVGDSVEAGARVASRWGMQWADFYENGDRRIDPISGNFGRIDASGQSLGMDHAAYLQLRGVYIRAAPPIPTVRYVHFGSSDLSQFNAFTVGKQRYIDRDNARGIFVDGGYKRWFGYHFARVALPKLYASAGWNTGIQDPLVQNPFWARDAVYVAKFSTEPLRWLSLENVNSVIIDEEADRDDPDALGSDNIFDKRDGVVQTNLRYTNFNSTVAGKLAWNWLQVTALGGLSRSAPDRQHVFNTVEGSQGFSPIPYKVAYGWALLSRLEILDPLGWNTFLRAEYFNIGPDWVATMGARRETDVLLTEGFMEGGQTPTLNIANEFMDFVDPWYESIIGWHGMTLQGEWAPGTSQIIGELTGIYYNTNTCNPGQDIVDGAVPERIAGRRLDTPWVRNGCSQGRDVDTIYPDFLYNQGMTDTDFYTFANTNDRGRDPRAVYADHQNRYSVISVLKGAYTIPVMRGITLRGRVKYIFDRDLRSRLRAEDDYLGHLVWLRAAVEWPINDQLSVGAGNELSVWFEKNRSGSVVAGRADYPDYATFKNKLHIEARYVMGPAALWYRLEYLNKDLLACDSTSVSMIQEEGRAALCNQPKPELNQHLNHVVRSIATISASF